MMVQLQEGIDSLLPYLLLFALGLAVVASLALVVLFILASLRGSGPSRPVAPRPVVSGGYGGFKPAGLGSETTGGLSETADGRSETTDGHWMKLVEECVEVVDELDEHMDSFDAPRREVARHVILRLEEVLGRSGVEVISNDATFDRARHKPTPATAATAPGAPISETLSPGFVVGRRVLRRARVRVG